LTSADKHELQTEEIARGVVFLLREVHHAR
jgi:hypothetical protein